MRLDQGKAMRIPTWPEYVDLQNPHRMLPDDRWMLYFYWLKRYVQSLNKKVFDLSERYRVVLRAFEEVRSMEDIKLMRQMMVVRMHIPFFFTFTSA